MYITTAENDIMILYRFTATSQGAMAKSICTVFYDDITIPTIIRVFIRRRSFTTF